MFLAYYTPEVADIRPTSEDLINSLLKYQFGNQAGYGASWFIFRWYDYAKGRTCALQTANASVQDVSQERNTKLKHAWGWKENYIPYEAIRKLPSDRVESWKETKLTAAPCRIDCKIGVTTMRRGYSREIRFHEGTGTCGDFERCVRDFVSLTDDQHTEQYDRRLLRFIWRGPGNLEPVYAKF